MPADTVIVLLAALIATLSGSVFSRIPLAVLSLTCSVLCYRYFVDGVGLWQSFAGWPLALALCCALCALLTLVFRQYLSRTTVHYLRYLHAIGIAINVSAVTMILAVGANLCEMAELAGLGFYGTTEMYGVTLTVCAVLSYLAVKNVPKFNEWLADISESTVLTALISVSLVSVLFTFDTKLSTPLSPVLLALAAYLGNCIARGRFHFGMSVLWQVIASVVTVPLVAAVSTFFLAAVGNPKLLSPESGRFLTMVILAAVVLAGAVTFASLKIFSSEPRMRKELIEREDLLSESKRVVNSLEIKTMQVENEYLRNHLKLQKQEVLNVAVSISEQKEFIGKIYESVVEARNLEDSGQKDEALRNIAGELKLRMNFSDRIDSFYADVEKVHKDFMIRLAEKFPNLTKQERRLTVLLRLEFSSKYIATLMDISPKSVEIGRHRLRSKLGLTRQQSLTGYIKTI